MVTTSDTFGPAFIYSDVGGPRIFQLGAGVLDISANTTYLDQIDRTVTTTNTYLISQTYEIDAAGASAAPEPRSYTLFLTGLSFIGLAKISKLIWRIFQPIGSGNRSI